MRRAARIDNNQIEIVAVLRGVGAIVTPTHQIGHGFPDLVVGYRGQNYLLEVKEPHGRLTADEATWHDCWRGQVRIVRSVDEALKAIGAV